jgi:MYXO-CTERM domain-containing protein
MNKSKIAMMVAASMGMISLANAELVTGTITADNHYSLYSSVGNSFAYHGGNELGAGGSPGTYNWSQAETYSFNAGDVLYIAAWSDDSVAQAVLCQFASAGLGTILSGDTRWEVFATNVNLGNGSPHPTASAIAGHVAFADANSLWEGVFAGGNNGISPWGTIAGITSNAKWMWKNVPGDPDPTQGGSGAAEMLIFRTSVPAPGPVALLGLGGLAMARRRR